MAISNHIISNPKINPIDIAQLPKRVGEINRQILKNSEDYLPPDTRKEISDSIALTLYSCIEQNKTAYTNFIQGAIEGKPYNLKENVNAKIAEINNINAHSRILDAKDKILRSF